MNNNTILQLKISKNRVVFNAYYEESIIQSMCITAKYEGGTGYYKKPEECFLSAACSLNDNPSCAVSGTHAEQFKKYCSSLDWVKVKKYQENCK